MTDLLIMKGRPRSRTLWPTKLRGTIAIHASKGFSRWEYEEGVDYLPVRYRKIVPAYEDIPRGAIIGMVDLVDRVEDSNSRWFGGPYGIKPIPCTGQLGFWNLPSEIERRIARIIRRPQL